MKYLNHKNFFSVVIFVAVMTASGVLVFYSQKRGRSPLPLPGIVGIYYPVHKNITVTTFWVGEKADRSNKYIANDQSAWDNHWQDHYGGADNPNDRNGYFPAGFTPKENPFYFALPYNDLNDNGTRRSDAASVVYWSGNQNWSPNQSMCKNQWIKITKGGKIVYAQWEDVGPFSENDAAYVFGNAIPESKTNNHAGLDVSPAVESYLGLKGEDKIDWQFVTDSQVPSGPWKQIVTASQISF
ncbi:MAG: hypothetical protein P4L62_04060 [Candidatus Pacebacteria bacterium]|nr:hypothetical protein [Candidatus Paceibacterota bacterium]